MTLRQRLRLLRLGLPTLLGLKPRGYFLPDRHAGSLPPAQPYAALELLFAAAQPEFRRTLALIDALAPTLLAFDGAKPPAPRWQQGWFPRLDGAAAYALVRQRRPARIVEIGSGHSTRFLARAAADAGHPAAITAITAIDPAPRAALAGLPVTAIRSTVQRAGVEPFRALGPGDLLFIDSSHLAVEGSDVDLLVGRILPAMPAGLLLHIHDISLPDPYPEAWRWRGYNEQTVVAALLAGSGFRLLFASHYVATRMAGDLAATVVARLPHPGEAPEGSLWLEKTAPATGRL